MLERLVIAGSGGQGVVLIGRLLALAALKRVPYLTFFPAYGAEVRGGTSNCQVILSSKEIASPLADEFDSMIVMNQASADKFLKVAGENCTAVVNTSLCRVARVPRACSINATELASQLGDACVANFIMLGAYLARKPVVSPEDIELAALQLLAKKNKSLVDMNIKAFRMGLSQ